MSHTLPVLLYANSVFSQTMNCMGCLNVMSNVTGITGNLCNKCPKWLVEQNSSCSDYFNAISGFTLNSRAPGGPVTVCLFCYVLRLMEWLGPRLMIKIT